MGDANQLDINMIVNEQEQGRSSQAQTPIMNQEQMVPKKVKLSHWIQISSYALFILVGQSVAVLLGRLYFTKGGKSKWLESLVQLIGFPMLIPLYYMLPIKTKIDHKLSFLKLVSIYVFLGLLIATSTMLYSFGLQYLPLTTYSLLCATQLGFIALFSFFLNGQKFTPYIVNSLVLLTISSILLALQQNDVSNTQVSKGKYALGFIFTITASSGIGLSFCLAQLVLQRMLKGQQHFRLILDLLIYQSLVGSCAITMGLFVSGEWRSLKQEMEEYKLGKVSYVMTLVWTAFLWQVYAIGVIGLIFRVSALFSNVISTLCLPITPVLAVIFLHDKMDGIKGVSLVLAGWGFVSYVYQHFLDEYKPRTNNEGLHSAQIAL